MAKNLCQKPVIFFLFNHRGSLQTQLILENLLQEREKNQTSAKGGKILMEVISVHSGKSQNLCSINSFPYQDNFSYGQK